MISARLRAARKRKKMTQQDLARLANTTKASISNYENEYSVPNYEILDRISTALGVSSDWLMGRSEYMEGAPRTKNEIMEDIVLEIEEMPDELKKEILNFIRFRKGK
jgi:transcriptional regulator with XRE-family HTH domain